ncbi:hypothetical protein BJY24_002783 [Nocardia transvalensis]|uniref:Uncharacterized protein n=1 Tax=Nocardia transvalensis TaxID=37333 RepID=A0A7W9PD13_9NOCA|nr:hypothetical protein [Nocardia transvalensis]MBB5913916.1 hypothetical protein [Nocardia transvalensis]
MSETERTTLGNQVGEFLQQWRSQGRKLEEAYHRLWTDPGYADLQRLVVRSAKEWTAALGEQPAGVPVWQFPLRAFEIAAGLADSEFHSDLTPMPAELCLELLSYTPFDYAAAMESRSQPV